MSDAIVKNLNFGEDARVNVFKGIEKLTQAVSSTLGASGKCVMLEDHTGRPIITKDGVTVADSIILRDPVENMGATLLKEAARKTVKEAGDGTTTATVLAHAILLEAYKVADKTNSRELKDGINSAVNKTVKYLKSLTVDVKGSMIDQIATISTNNDPLLGKIIADAFRSVDNTGVVMMETASDGKNNSADSAVSPGTIYFSDISLTCFNTSVASDFLAWFLSRSLSASTSNRYDSNGNFASIAIGPGG